MDTESVKAKYRELTETLIERSITVTTMESCTSGLIASLITDTEGSSAVFKGGYVTYSNEMKIRCGVPAQVIRKHGVYSTETAAAMARACREEVGADIGIGITGSFGNVDHGNADSVPGEVFFAISTADSTESYHCTVPTQPDRLAYKLYMAETVVDKLFGILPSGPQELKP